MKQHILFAAILFSFTMAHAQFNDSTFYLVRYSATGILNRTNDASSYALSNGLRFSVKNKKIVLNSSNNWVYGEQQKQLTNNDFNTSLDANWYPNLNHFYYWGLGTYETSYSLKVNSRSQAGVGGAYNLVDKPNFFFNISDGILYEFADLAVNSTIKDVYNTFRNSFRLRLRYVYNNRVTIETTSFLQNSLQQKTDYIINTNTSVSFKLAKWIGLSGSLNYNKVNRTRRENMLVTFGITAEKYF